MVLELSKCIEANSFKFLSSPVQNRVSRSWNKMPDLIFEVMVLQTNYIQIHQVKKNLSESSTLVDRALKKAAINPTKK